MSRNHEKATSTEVKKANFVDNKKSDNDKNAKQRKDEMISKDRADKKMRKNGTVLAEINDPPEKATGTSKGKKS